LFVLSFSLALFACSFFLLFTYRLTMQYVIQSSSIISAALLHAMKDVLGLADAFMETSAEGPHRVTVNGKTYKGLQAVLLALRMQASTPEQQNFFGDSDNEEQIALVNQWVGAASILEVDAMRAANDATASVAKTVYADIERILASTPNGATQFLTGSPRATVADLLVYAAAFNHPLHNEVLPTTMAWAAHVQEDASVAPLRSAAVVAHHKAHKSAAAAGGKAEVTYVKPSEEEILRRRAEKEKAKAEKEAAKAAAAAAKGSDAPVEEKSKKASASPSAKGKKAELDSTSLYVRVGQLTNLRRHPDADRLFIEDMVLGDETRTIVSGLVEHYKAEELEGTYCLVVCNMKPKPLMGVTSHGMVLCAKKEEKVLLIRPPAGAKPGDRVLFGASYDAAVAAAAPPEPVSGNKMSEVLSHLRTNGEGVLCWKGEPALHPSGAAIVIAEMPDCPVS
jgi:aminoacyl tRNA synthase complex-interacting multifunctional protein 1